MFKYDSFYDNLFQNSEFVELLHCFHESNWEKTNIKDRRELISKFIELYAQILKIESKLKSKKIKNKRFSGCYLDSNGQVSVNESLIEKGNCYDVLDTLFHELRHNYQRRAIVNNISDLETANPEEVKEWKLNFMTSPTGISNYISTSNPETQHMYYYQSVERDAFSTGLALTKKSYEIISQKLGKDESFVKYAKEWQNIIMLLFSKDEPYKSMKEKMIEELHEYYRKNNKSFEIENKCMAKASEILNKDIDKLTVEEMHCLFSTYVWGHVDFNKQFDILKQYDKLTNNGDVTEIVKSGNSAFKIEGCLVVNTDILGCLNNIYSSQYVSLVECILYDEIEFDAEAKKELAINMYEHNKKMINYVKDEENFILYSIQPYGVYEGRIIYNQFSNVKKDIYEFYGIEDDNYNVMIDYYDYSKYIPYIESFFEKPFKDIYNENVEFMKERIIKIESTKR